MKYFSNKMNKIAAIKPIHITERDQKILRAINRFGYTDAKYVSTYFKWNRKLTYRRLRLLAQNDFLKHEQIFHHKAGVYRVTKNGAEMSNDHLSPIRKVNLATYEHQLKVLNLSLKLTQEHDGDFISERELRHQFGFASIRDKRHIPDGVLEIGEQRIAIEVELSVKSEKRLEKILRHYQKDFSYQNVWYYCGTQEIRNKIDRISTNAELIKTYLLKL